LWIGPGAETTRHAGRILGEASHKNCDNCRSLSCDAATARTLPAPAKPAGDVKSGITSTTAGPGAAARNRSASPGSRAM
jgi:hypothetical protein